MEGVENFLVSIVIPIYNGEKYISRCLSAIFKQEVDFSYEVICIDSSSTDRSLDIIKSFPVRILRINKNEFNHGLTRNLGISQTNGKYVILLTQDAIPSERTWMKALIKNIEEDEKVAGVYCRQIPREDADILTKRNLNNHLTARREKVTSFIQDSKKYESLTPMERYIFCNFDNVCSCIRRNVWEKIPFRETNFAEDLDWSKRILQAGYKIVYEPKTAVIHSHNSSFLYQYRRAYIHHKRLYELFQVQPVSTWGKVVLFSICNILRDACYVLKNEKLSTQMFQELLTLPLSSFLKILGQYRGAVASRIKLLM